MKVSVLQVDRCKPILGLNAFDHAPVRQHLERELVQSPVQDSQIQDWPKATTFLGYDEVRAVKPLPHLGWRDRLDCILCQEDSNLLAQDRGVPDCHRRLENAVELGRSPDELNRMASMAVSSGSGAAVATTPEGGSPTAPSSSEDVNPSPDAAIDILSTDGAPNEMLGAPWDRPGNRTGCSLREE